MAVPEGRERSGSLSNDSDDPSLARGAAGSESGAPDTANGREPEGDLESRRETEQVLRPGSDGMGEGLPKDQG